MQYIVALLFLLCSSLDSFAAAPAPLVLDFDYSGPIADTVKKFLQAYFWDDQNPNDSKHANVFHKRKDRRVKCYASKVVLDFENLSTDERNGLFNWLEDEPNGQHSLSRKKRAMDVAFEAIPEAAWKGIRWSEEYKLLNQLLGGGYHRTNTLLTDWNKLPLLKRLELLERAVTAGDAKYTDRVKNYHSRLQEYAALVDFSSLLFGRKHENAKYAHTIAAAAPGGPPPGGGAAFPGTPKQLIDKQISERIGELGIDSCSFYDEVSKLTMSMRHDKVSDFIARNFRIIEQKYLGNYSYFDSAYADLISEFVNSNFSQNEKDRLIELLFNIHYNAYFGAIVSDQALTPAARAKLDAEARLLGIIGVSPRDKLLTINSILPKGRLDNKVKDEIEQLRKALLSVVCPIDILELLSENDPASLLSQVIQSPLVRDSRITAGIASVGSNKLIHDIGRAQYLRRGQHVAANGSVGAGPAPAAAAGAAGGQNAANLGAGAPAGPPPAVPPAAAQVAALNPQQQLPELDLEALKNAAVRRLSLSKLKIHQRPIVPNQVVPQQPQGGGGGPGPAPAAAPAPVMGGAGGPTSTTPLWQTWGGGRRDRDDSWKWLYGSGGGGDPSPEPRNYLPGLGLGIVITPIVNLVNDFVSVFHTGSKPINDAGSSELYDPLAALRRLRKSFYDTYQVVAPSTPAI
ncbi:MAG: hypothetical protein LBL30_00125 [Holosporales bacterium]|jgi:hypothetical protein|nr:hypothetical protein [Holosporales bacterium]